MHIWFYAITGKMLCMYPSAVQQLLFVKNKVIIKWVSDCLCVCVKLCAVLFLWLIVVVCVYVLAQYLCVLI